MKRKGIILIAFISLLLSVSCNIELLENGETVNGYIYPYLEFTAVEDGWSVSVVKGAALEVIRIPEEAEIEGRRGKVTLYCGFGSAGDEHALKEIVFESSSTRFSPELLHGGAGSCCRVKYEKVENAGAVWSLPHLESTYEREMQGWYLEGSDIRIQDGDVMVPGYTDVSPRWRSHNWKKVAGKEPTCTEEGWNVHEECINSGCGYSTKVILPPMGHSVPLIRHEAGKATCISTGYTQTWFECSRCHRAFGDESASAEIDIKDIEIPVTGHTSDGTVRHDGNAHWWHCAVCNADYGREGHTFSDWRKSEREGFQERECTICRYVETAGIEHRWTRVEESAPTCTAKGHTAYWKCTLHEGEYSLLEDGKEIIGEKTLHEKTDIPELPHDLSAWKYDETQHWKQCSMCHGEFEKGEHVFQYTFRKKDDGTYIVEEKCSVCETVHTEPSSSPSAFEVTSLFGNVSARKTDDYTWLLTYTGKRDACYWADEDGNRLKDGREFTFTKAIRTTRRVKIFCSALDGSGTVVETALVVLPSS